MENYKWDFLENKLVELILLNPEESNASIARKLIKIFSLNVNAEVMRVHVSRTRKSLNKKQSELNSVVNVSTIGDNKSSKPDTNPNTHKVNMLEGFGKSTSTKDVIPLWKEQVATEVKWHNQQDGLHLVIGCVHVPFENKILWEKLLLFVAQHKHLIAGIHIIGDFIDCASISAWDKGKLPLIDGLTLEYEYKIAETRLQELLLTGIDLSTTTINYHYGNHDGDRVTRYNSDAQNSKNPVQYFGEFFDKNNKRFHVNFTTDSIKVGKFELLHGLYYNQHCAKQHIDKLRINAVFVHTHRLQSHVEGILESHNIGWLGDINAKAFNYADRGMKSQWRNGFGVITVDGNDSFFEQVICDGNKFTYGGRIY